MTNQLVKYAIDSHKTNAKRIAEIIKRDSKAIMGIVNKLQTLGINVPHISIDGTSFNINITGSKDDLGMVFGLMRREGYEPSTRPADKQESYVAFWNNEKTKSRIWIYFTSTTCKRVQVGTKMQEVPVYETVCEE
jgi:hypothetical protein